MIRKWIGRLFLGGCLLSFSGISVVLACIWLATLQPSFHANLMAQSNPANDHEKVEVEMRQLELVLSAMAQQQNLSAEKQALSQTIAQSFAAKEIHSLQESGLIDLQGNLVINQNRLNALFVDDSGSHGDLQNIRIQIAEDHLKLGSEVKTQDYGSFYLSVDLRPSLTDDGELKLELLAGRIGLLTLPVRFALKFIAEDFNRKNPDMELRTEDANPYVIIHRKQNAEALMSIKQIRCQQDQITLELSKPILLPQ